MKIPHGWVLIYTLGLLKFRISISNWCMGLRVLLLVLPSAGEVGVSLQENNQTKRISPLRDLLQPSKKGMGRGMTSETDLPLLSFTKNIVLSFLVILCTVFVIFSFCL